jgi:hypothetical protein
MAMKKLLLIVIMSVTGLFATPISAEQAPPADKGVQAKSSVPNVAELDKQIAQAQENLKIMQDQMDKIRQTQDPQERQNLLQEHWATRQRMMGMMHGMWWSGSDNRMGCW